MYEECHLYNCATKLPIVGSSPSSGGQEEDWVVLTHRFGEVLANRRSAWLLRCDQTGCGPSHTFLVCEYDSGNTYGLYLNNLSLEGIPPSQAVPDDPGLPDGPVSVAERRVKTALVREL
jgi:hypothetical protein